MAQTPPAADTEASAGIVRAGIQQARLIAMLQRRKGRPSPRSSRPPAGKCTRFAAPSRGPMRVKSIRQYLLSQGSAPEDQHREDAEELPPQTFSPGGCTRPDRAAQCRLHSRSVIGPVLTLGRWWPRFAQDITSAWIGLVISNRRWPANPSGSSNNADLSYSLSVRNCRSNATQRSSLSGSVLALRPRSRRPLVSVRKQGYPEGGGRPIVRLAPSRHSQRRAISPADLLSAGTPRTRVRLWAAALIVVLPVVIPVRFCCRDALEAAAAR